jgi:beta-glucosidase
MVSQPPHLPIGNNASRSHFDFTRSMTASSINADALLEQMTFEEKVSVLGGESFFGTKSIPRLGTPSVKFTDGPNGARGGTINDGVKAACFPASVSLAATWDESLVYRVGVALAEETKTKSAVAVHAPTICPHRSPLGGRNFESFSEDPLLAGILASRYVNGLQDTGIGAVVKHYAANEQETMRRMINVVVGERALREIYLKPFEIVAKTANPWSTMTSYNRLNGHHADSSEYLLHHVLRDQ